jgi:deoxyhypusine synthase
MGNLKFTKKTKILGHKVVERIGDVKGKGDNLIDAEKAIVDTANKLRTKKNKPNANWLIKVRITNTKSGKVAISGILAEVNQLYPQ